MHAGAAALLELAAEPLYILGAAQLRFRLRVGAEAAATLARGAVTLALLARSACAPAIALSWGQVLPSYRTRFSLIAPVTSYLYHVLVPIGCMCSAGSRSHWRPDT